METNHVVVFTVVTLNMMKFFTRVTLEPLNSDMRWEILLIRSHRLVLT